MSMLYLDEVFMLIKGTALVWYDDQEYEIAEGGVVFLPKGGEIRQPHPRPATLTRVAALV